VKFIEQQLLSAMAETPPETDCSVSAAVLIQIGLMSRDIQREWLEGHRPARDGKLWHLTGDRWEYAAQASIPIPTETSFALPAPLATRVLPSEPRSVSVVVKPLAPIKPLRGTRRSARA
jgi:hypothetical protein